MEKRQIELLKNLAKKLKAEKKDREAIVLSLQKAKILTKKENFTKSFHNLERVVVNK